MFWASSTSRTISIVTKTRRPILFDPLRIPSRRRADTYRWHTSSSNRKPVSSPNSGGGSDWKSVTAKSYFIGTAAGVMGSLAGMGGGFVMIPLMTSQLLRLTQHQAHGTSLFAVMATGCAGAISYGDNVQYEAAAAVALFGMLSARVGAKVTARMSEKTLKRALGALMLAMAPCVPAKAYIMEKYGQSKRNEQVREGAEGKDDLLWRLVPPAFIGLGSGFLAGVFGVGGGVIVVPALALASDMNHYQALATSLAAMTPPAAVGTWTHYTAGNVVMRVAPPLALGAFCGAYVGAQIASKTDESTLRWGFSGLLSILGIQTILKTF